MGKKFESLLLIFLLGILCYFKLGLAFMNKMHTLEYFFFWRFLDPAVYISTPWVQKLYKMHWKVALKLNYSYNSKRYFRNIQVILKISNFICNQNINRLRFWPCSSVQFLSEILTLSVLFIAFRSDMIFSFLHFSTEMEEFNTYFEYKISSNLHT